MLAVQNQKAYRPNPVMGIDANGQLIMRPIVPPGPISASDYVPPRPPRYDPIPPPDHRAMSLAYEQKKTREAEQAEEARKRAGREAEEQEEKRMMDRIISLDDEIIKLNHELERKKDEAKVIENQIKGTFVVDKNLVRLQQEIFKIPFTIRQYEAEIMDLQNQVNGVPPLQPQPQPQPQPQQQQPQQQQPQQQQPQPQQQQPQPQQQQPQPQPQQQQQQEQQPQYSYHPSSLAQGAWKRVTSFLPGKRGGRRSNKKGKKSTRRPNKKGTRRHSKKNGTRRH